MMYPLHFYASLVVIGLPSQTVWHRIARRHFSGAISVAERPEFAIGAADAPPVGDTPRFKH
jgi:hypothetical protein